MMPASEPNALPQPYGDWSEWRESYTAYVAYFNASPKTYSDEVQLEIRLKRLGYVGTRLEAEMTYIKEGCK